MLSHASLKNNKHLNILSSQLKRRKEETSQDSQEVTPSSRVHACRMRRGGWGGASILSVMHNVAPDIVALLHVGSYIPNQGLNKD